LGRGLDYEDLNPAAYVNYFDEKDARNGRGV
jgi:hypothetical protein